MRIDIMCLLCSHSHYSPLVLENSSGCSLWGQTTNSGLLKKTAKLFVDQEANK